MIKLKHIYKSYSLGDEQVDVLHDINLHVSRKNLYPFRLSGSGKSTLMNIIGCLDIPDSGDYIPLTASMWTIVRKMSFLKSGAKNWVYFSNSLIFYPRLTAYENVEMPLLYHKLSQPRRRREWKGRFTK